VEGCDHVVPQDRVGKCGLPGQRVTRLESPNAFNQTDDRDKALLILGKQF
jgi:hypothetical protein